MSSKGLQRERRVNMDMAGRFERAPMVTTHNLSSRKKVTAQDRSSWKLTCLVVGLIATSLFLLIVTVRISMKYASELTELKNKTNWIEQNSNLSVKICDKEAQLLVNILRLRNELRKVEEKYASCLKKVEKLTKTTFEASTSPDIYIPNTFDARPLQGICLYGWMLVNQKCLFFSVIHSSWGHGKRDCEEKRSTLLIFEQDNVDLQHERLIMDNWYWIGNEVVNRRMAVYSKVQLCTSLQHGKLKNEPCVNSYKWICERNPIRS